MWSSGLGADETEGWWRSAVKLCLFLRIEFVALLWVFDRALWAGFWVVKWASGLGTWLCFERIFLWIHRGFYEDSWHENAQLRVERKKERYICERSTLHFMVQGTRVSAGITNLGERWNWRCWFCQNLEVGEVHFNYGSPYRGVLPTPSNDRIN